MTSCKDCNFTVNANTGVNMLSYVGVETLYDLYFKVTSFVAISIHRFYRRANLGLSDKPLQTLTEDRVLFGVIILYFVGAYLSLYYPPMERLLSAMLFR